MVIKSLLNWFNLFPKTVEYILFRKSSFNIAPHIDFVPDEHLYKETMTLDRMEETISRNSLDFYTVCAIVGGTHKVFLSLSTFFLAYYSKLSFVIEASCSMFKIKSEDSSLTWIEHQLQVSFFDKLKLLLNIGADKKLKRLI